MDLISAFSEINKSTLGVIKDLCVVDSIVDVEPIEPLRLKEQPFILTDKIKRVTAGVITAHDLSQYRNQFHSIHLEDKVDSWLLYLLEADKEDLNAFTGFDSKV